MDSTTNLQQDVSIAGLDKGDVLKALWEGSRAQGTSFLSEASGVSIEECRAAVATHPRFDYWNGRVLKVDLSGDTFDPWGYDRDNGQGAAQRVIEAIR